MARLPRIVIPGLPHHITQRGNRRERTFFGDEDYLLYRDLLAQAAARARVQIWAYCLMPNHVHIIVMPIDQEGIRRRLAPRKRGPRAQVKGLSEVSP